MMKTKTRDESESTPKKSVSWQKPLVTMKLYEAKGVKVKLAAPKVTDGLRPGAAGQQAATRQSAHLRSRDLTPVEPEQDEEMSERVDARALTAPPTPTQLEREEHNVTHLPFRSWSVSYTHLTLPTTPYV